MRYFFLIILFLNFSFLFCQNKDHEKKTVDSGEGILIKTQSVLSTDSLKYTIRSPLKASLYSAVLPGLGQIYNKKYWKAPVAFGLVTTGVLFVRYYDKQYNGYHKAYLAQLAGLPHQYSGIPGISATMLASAQDDSARYRNYSIALTVLAYLLNIIDATVDAHLSVFDKDKDLALKPVIIQEEYAMMNQKLGLGVSFRF